MKFKAKIKATILLVIRAWYPTELILPSSDKIYLSSLQANQHRSLSRPENRFTYYQFECPLLPQTSGNHASARLFLFCSHPPDERALLGHCYGAATWDLCKSDRLLIGSCRSENVNSLLCFKDSLLERNALELEDVRPEYGSPPVSGEYFPW